MGDVERELNREVMRSSQFRAALVGVTAASGFAFFLVAPRLGSDPYADLYAGTSPNALLGAATLLVMAFEATWRRAIGRLHARGVVLGAWTHVGVATVEMTVLSVTLWALGESLSEPALALALPSSLIYFPLVVLSAFYLDARVVAAVTVVAVGQYLGTLALLGVPSGAAGALGPFGSVWLFVHEASILAFTGAFAAVVAGQARTRVLRAVTDRVERERVVRLWGRHLAPGLVRSIVAGDPEPRLQHVAILFLDVRGFTAYAEGRAPEEVVAFLNGFFEIAVGAVLAHGGVVHQLLGDGLMALFGVPDAQSDCAERAVRAALDVHRAVGEAVENGALPATRIGVGVHCGEVLLGLVGTPSYREYKVTGDAVNVAARIEGLNKEVGSDVLVSEDAWQLAGLDLPSERVGPLHVHGRAAPVHVHRLA